MKAFSNYPTAFKRLFQGILCTIISQTINSYAPKAYLLEPQFGQENYIYKILLTIGAMQSVIWNYFSGFCIIEANLIACGLGYINDNGQESFNNIRMVGIIPIETSTTFQYIGQNWNIPIHYWLKYYVMLRLMDRSKPKGAPQTYATVCTFIASSLWHGTYPGYLVLFIGLALLEIQSKHFHKLTIAVSMKKIFHPLLLDVGLRIWLHYAVAYCGMAFVFLKFSSFHQMHLNLGYVMHILVSLVTLMTLYLPKDKSAKLKDS